MLLRMSRLQTLVALSFGVSLLTAARSVSPRHSALILESLSWFLIVLAAFGLSRLAARWYKVLKIKRQSAAVAAGLLDPSTLPSGIASAVRDRAIARLYVELGELTEKKFASPAQDLDGEIGPRFSRLRSLQEEQAAEMRKWLDASFPLKPGEGRRALKEARELLAKYENSSTPDSPIPHQSRP